VSVPSRPADVTPVAGPFTNFPRGGIAVFLFLELIRALLFFFFFSSERGLPPLKKGSAPLPFPPLLVEGDRSSFPTRSKRRARICGHQEGFPFSPSSLFKQHPQELAAARALFPFFPPSPLGAIFFSGAPEDGLFFFLFPLLGPRSGDTSFFLPAGLFFFKFRSGMFKTLRPSSRSAGAHFFFGLRVPAGSPERTTTPVSGVS